ncbi:MAG: hypothetical protein KDA78_21720, partial [Planctomycetaceae bacterium]|nr:hypothetical protein [Planctomycetaceae bacterium]
PLRDLRDFLNHLALQQQSVRIWTPERVQQDLEQLFDAIQRLTGAQGMGVYDATSPTPFRLRLVQGERCLGEPDPVWLDAVLKRNQGVWIENSPAEGWNELMIPLPGQAGQNADFLVRLTSRKLQDQDLLLAQTGLQWVYSQILQLRQTIIHQAPVLLDEMLERQGLAGFSWQDLNSSEGPLVKTWDNWCR